MLTVFVLIMQALATKDLMNAATFDNVELMKQCITNGAQPDECKDSVSIWLPNMLRMTYSFTFICFPILYHLSKQL